LSRADDYSTYSRYRKCQKLYLKLGHNHFFPHSF
jgi:hypothetical protein